MVGILFAIIISYILSSFLGYVIHWSLHQTWMGFLNKAHMTHHLQMYPPNDYKSDVYRHAGKDSTPKYFILVTLPIVLLLVTLTIIGIIPLYGSLIFVLMATLMGILHDRLHDSFHLNNYWLAKIPVIKNLYQKWINLHYIHHVDMGKNYSIFVFHWDRVFRTFQK